MWFEKLITGGVDKVIDSASKGLDRLFTSDEERLKAEILLNQIKAEITTTLISSFTKVIKMQSDIIISEIKGESWLQRNWRATTMMIFTFIIANEYILAPYIQLLFNIIVPVKPLAPQMWNLLTLGMGGYVSALGVKKVVEATKWGK